jgi:hypothetical protein
MFETAYSGENAKWVLKQKVAQMFLFLWAASPLNKNYKEVPKVAQ